MIGRREEDLLFQYPTEFLEDIHYAQQINNIEGLEHSVESIMEEVQV